MLFEINFKLSSCNEVIVFGQHLMFPVCRFCFAINSSNMYDWSLTMGQTKWIAVREITISIRASYWFCIQNHFFFVHYDSIRPG